MERDIFFFSLSLSLRLSLIIIYLFKKQIAHQILSQFIVHLGFCTLTNSIVPSRSR